MWLKKKKKSIYYFILRHMELFWSVGNNLTLRVYGTT